LRRGAGGRVTYEARLGEDTVAVGELAFAVAPA
jgi:hypothetical protein